MNVLVITFRVMILPRAAPTSTAIAVMFVPVVLILQTTGVVLHNPAALVLPAIMTLGSVMLVLI